MGAHFPSIPPPPPLGRSGAVLPRPLHCSGCRRITVRRFQSVINSFISNKIDAKLGTIEHYADFVFNGVLTCMAHFYRVPVKKDTVHEEQHKILMNDVINDACRIMPFLDDPSVRGQAGGGACVSDAL